MRRKEKKLLASRSLISLTRGRKRREEKLPGFTTHKGEDTNYEDNPTISPAITLLWRGGHRRHMVSTTPSSFQVLLDQSSSLEGEPTKKREWAA